MTSASTGSTAVASDRAGRPERLPTFLKRLYPFCRIDLNFPVGDQPIEKLANGTEVFEIDRRRANCFERLCSLGVQFDCLAHVLRVEPGLIAVRNLVEEITVGLDVSLGDIADGFVAHAHQDIGKPAWKVRLMFFADPLRELPGQKFLDLLRERVG